MLRPRRLFSSISAAHDLYEEPTVNLTPLIDVVFVVLIAFIIVAPLLNYEEVALATASDSALKTKAVTEQSSIAVSVTADNLVTVNKQKVALQQLPTLLQELRRRHPEVRPQLFHDERATFGTYCAVKRALEEAGYTHLDVILTPSSSRHSP